MHKRSRIRDEYGTGYNRANGYSLVELLTVIVILAILLMAAISRYLSITEGTKADICRTNIRAIKSAAATYEIKEKEMPRDINALVTKGYLDRFLDCPYNKDYILEDGEIINLKTDHFAGNWRKDEHN